jgi:hypothetical protein
MQMPMDIKENDKKKQIKVAAFLEAMLEVGFIIFLYYSNLLMGEYTHSGLAKTKGLMWALCNIFTIYNFTIAIVTGVIGHFVFDFLSERIKQKSANE